MVAAAAWDQVLHEVRTKPGFENFLLPPALSDLMPTPGTAPVVAVTVGRFRSDAIIVGPTAVTALELPRLTLDDLLRHVEAFTRVMRLERPTPVRSGTRDLAPAGGTTPETTLNDLLIWLWDVLAEPVLEKLGLTATPAGPDWPRIWWCPTGPLGLLPLHAAGHHGLPRTGRSVLDRAVSSYTPTVRALRAATARPAAPEPDRVLVVGLEETPGQADLPGVRQESAAIRRGLPRSVDLSGPDATRAAVLASLPGYSAVHFGCHGDQDLREPSKGSLLLYDGPLTIAELRYHRAAGEIAFLSACKSATGGVGLTDEAVTLAAALHHIGYRHVVGTLWSVFDDTAASLADLFYADLTSGGRLRPHRCALALHHAVRAIRDTTPVTSWSPFIHIGP